MYDSIKIYTEQAYYFDSLESTKQNSSGNSNQRSDKDYCKHFAVPSSAIFISCLKIRCLRLDVNLKMTSWATYTQECICQKTIFLMKAIISRSSLWSSRDWLMCISNIKINREHIIITSWCCQHSHTLAIIKFFLIFGLNCPTKLTELALLSLYASRRQFWSNSSMIIQKRGAFIWNEPGSEE